MSTSTPNPVPSDSASSYRAIEDRFARRERHRRLSTNADRRRMHEAPDYAERVSSSQSNTRWSNSGRLPISQWSPAPSAAVKRTRVFGPDKPS